MEIYDFDYTDDKGEVDGGPDTRPAWARRLQGYTCDWSQIARVAKTCETAGIALTDEYKIPPLEENIDPSWTDGFKGCI